MKQKFIVIFFLIVFIAASAARPLIGADSRISIGVTETMESQPLGKICWTARANPSVLAPD